LTEEQDPWPAPDEPGPTVGPIPAPVRGPSKPTDPNFNPLATAIGVFTAIAIPAAVFGYTRPGGSSATIVVIGVLIALAVGVIAGVWVAARGGRVWRGRQL
jgi:hypothetical protein